MLKTKVCAACKVAKPLSEFGYKSNGSRRSYCQSCKLERGMRYKQANPERVHRWNKSARLKRKYGITIEEYEEKVKAQHGRCASCGKKPKLLNFDHNHKTGQNRDLLCSSCNIIAGWLENHPKQVRLVIQYLKRHKGPSLR